MTGIWNGIKVALILFKDRMVDRISRIVFGLITKNHTNNKCSPPCRSTRSTGWTICNAIAAIVQGVRHPVYKEIFNDP